MAPRRPPRDFLGDMNELAQGLIGGKEPFIISEVAKDLVGKLRVDDKELLLGWLDTQAENIVGDYLSTLSRSVRARNRMVGARTAFGDVVRRHEEGDTQVLTTWLSTSFVVSDDHVHKHLGEMDRSDLTFVADTYDRQSRSAAFEAAWFKAIAKKVPANSTVGDVFTEEKLVAMRQSIDKMFGK